MHSFCWECLQTLHMHIGMEPCHSCQIEPGHCVAGLWRSNNEQHAVLGPVPAGHAHPHAALDVFIRGHHHCWCAHKLVPIPCHLMLSDQLFGLLLLSTAWLVSCMLVVIGPAPCATDRYGSGGVSIACALGSPQSLQEGRKVRISFVMCS